MDQGALANENECLETSGEFSFQVENPHVSSEWRKIICYIENRLSQDEMKILIQFVEILERSAFRQGAEYVTNSLTDDLTRIFKEIHAEII